ncbi:hypothetical protein [Flavobacterium gilvum]|uniref:Uncharacterized protein n=1 Tax=Flavobacterium gilvum TaxID=1492737 RepID=A0AAC9N7J7_9FLAO|nr:hypothetical protein [Flavobacterium gilvum]AOW11024.1 hypothetical protein EM308_16875 [Flavobacterium gilvum]KFC59176.1 hypothetical protein FEM08_20370 [Flavobacterium gilvum]
MSGGAFDYKQYHIREIHETIQGELEKMGKPKSKDDLYGNEEYYEKYPEELNWAIECEEVVNTYKTAIELLKKAEVYVQRIDWYLSGDDGVESFLRRLKEDLEKL